MAFKDGAYHLATFNDAAKYQPVRTNNFRFLVDFKSNLQMLDGNSSDKFFESGNATEVIDFSVVKFDVPHFGQDLIEINRGNSKIYFAGKASYDAGTLVINDFAGANGKSVLEAWQALSYNPIDDTIPSAENYKMDAKIIEMLPDGTPNRAWQLYGCWITKLSETGYDNNNPAKKEITATIRYDRAIPLLDIEN